MIDEKKLIEEIKSLRVTVNGLRAGKGVLREFEKHYRESILRTIEEQPKVGYWIPCSERLPKRDGTYQLKEFAVTIDSGEHVYASHASYDFYNEKWLVHKSKVIAWMPLPEPYRPEKESE